MLWDVKVLKATKANLGASLPEAVLSLTLITLIIFALIDTVMSLYTKLSLNHVVYQTARALTLPGAKVTGDINDINSGKAFVVSEGIKYGLKLNTSQVQICSISYHEKDSPAPFPTTTCSNTSLGDASDIIKVSASLSYTPKLLALITGPIEFTFFSEAVGQNQGIS